MNTADMLTLVEYNKWANNRLMRRAAHLSQEQLSEPCWLSQGNLYDSLIHTVDAQWSWRLACQASGYPRSNSPTLAPFGPIGRKKTLL